MNTETRINISSVIEIREAIEQIFTLIHRHLDAYTADPDDVKQIEDCQYYIHQLNGMLEMLELGGVSFVGNSVEVLMVSLHEQRIEPDFQVLTALKQAVRSIYRYLDTLMDGEEDNPVRLFPVYRKIMQVQGVKNIPESDLFFPYTREALPLQSVQSDLVASSRQDAARQARTQFQSGLLGWLRDAHDKQSLQEMIDAGRAIEKLPASTEQRTFWWISSGFLDGLLHQEEAVDKSARRLCGKIEQEIRHLGKEAHVTAGRLTRELLYRIARSQSASERIQEISRIYDWQDLLASFDSLMNLDDAIMDEDAGAPNLQVMRTLLEDINDRWRKFSADDQDSLVNLLTLTERLKVSAAQTNCPSLKKLTGVMHGALSYLQIRPQNMNEGVSLDIATSLLLLENAIDNFYRLSPEFPSQVEALTTRIRAVTTGKGSDIDLPDLPSPDQAGHLAQEKKLLKQVAQEILVNLAQVEDILDRFFFEPDIRNDLSILPGLFKQIGSVPNMLELDHAETLLGLCQDHVKNLTNLAWSIDPAEQTLLADALSSLGFYIEALRNSQPDSERIITAAISLFNQYPVEQPLPLDAPVVSAELSSLLPVFVLESARDQVADPELLAIFLDESSEVLANVSDQLEACYIDQTDLDALTAIRRGFHTLKGSGRMVELPDLSEVAWRIEQLINRWLSEQKPAIGTLLDLLADSHRQFSNWCASLRKDGTAEIRAAHLLDRIREMMYGADGQSSVSVGMPVHGHESVPAVEPEAFPTTAQVGVDANVRIGDIEIQEELFRIFVNEAGTHADTLKQALGTSGEDIAQMVTYEPMLAAHTLASTSRALGLNFIAQIGQVLEQWFIRLQAVPARPDIQVRSRMTTAVNLLDIMMEAVRNQQLPSEDTLQAGNETAKELSRLLESFSGQITETVPDDRHVEIIPEKRKAVDTVTPFLFLQSSNDELTGVDRELLEVFLEEAQELQSVIGASLRTWHNQPGQAAARKTLLRALHTLKGSARIAGALQVSDQAHQMENAIESIYEETVSQVLIDQLEVQFDAISESIEQLHLSLQPELEEGGQEIARNEEDLVLFRSQSMLESAPVFLNTPEARQPARKTVLRVDAEWVDRLVNESSESSIVRSRVEAQLYDFKQYLQDLGESVDRMRGQLREIELLAETHIPSDAPLPLEEQAIFDPLELDRFTRFQELTRLMTESMDGVITTHKSLRETQRTAEAAVNQQAHLNRQLQKNLIRIRTVPFRHFSDAYITSSDRRHGI